MRMFDGPLLSDVLVDWQAVSRTMAAVESDAHVARAFIA
jgi:hypothetical protein